MLVLANEIFNSPPVFAWVLSVFVRLRPGKEGFGIVVLPGNVQASVGKHFLFHEPIKGVNGRGYLQLSYPRRPPLISF